MLLLSVFVLIVVTKKEFMYKNSKIGVRTIEEISKQKDPIFGCPLCYASVCINPVCNYALNTHGYYEIVDGELKLLITQKGLDFFKSHHL